MLIFEKSRRGRRSPSHTPYKDVSYDDIPQGFLRKTLPHMAEVSELQAVRHYTLLSQKNFSIDTNFYPLGSCTMKYNPRVCNTLSMLPGFLLHHPDTPYQHSKGLLACLYELQQMLAEVSGMQAVALSPMAGAQGEFAGVSMIRAYHEERNDTARTEILVPDAAHGTNPASAVMCGYKVREIPTNDQGDVDIEALKQAVGPHTAGIMLTNPSTLGVFERRIAQILQIVHQAGGLSYYDGANLNAIVGKTRPGDMGFDVIHINVHKTFSTPHGGGGPGGGPVGASARLVDYLPIPRVKKEKYRYRWLEEEDCPKSIGRLSAHAGNIGVMLRAYIYMRLLGAEGMKRVAEFSTLNANYLMVKLREAGFSPAFEDRRATHEFILSLKDLHTQTGIGAKDFAKRLIDFGVHAPTTYFPLLVPECLLIEPTETEAKEDLDDFVEIMKTVLQEAKTNPAHIRGAPYNLPVRRVDDLKAARELDLVWKSEDALKAS